MTIAILSDMHLGDPTSRLQHAAGVAQAPAYEALKRVLRAETGGGPVDLLVLNGDIIDFAIGSFAASCAVARGFFDALAADGLARRILYVPGNHDKHVWDAVEWQVNVIDRMGRGDLPRPFRRTQPAVVDLTTGGVDLPGVTPGYEEGTLFLQGLFSPSATSVPILVAYPNVYLVSPDRTVTVVSHGHLMALAWVLLSELLRGMPELNPHPGLPELEEYNYPVTAAICTAVGQAGAVTDLIAEVQHEVKAGRLDLLYGLLERVLHTAVQDGAGAVAALPATLLKIAGPGALRGALPILRGARHDVAFWHRELTVRLFARFDDATRAEATSLGLADPVRYLFGHTHAAIPAEHHESLVLGDRRVKLFNTGGWIDTPGEGPCVAAVFFVDAQGGLRSVEVR